jgi:hypothetical protein
MERENVGVTARRSLRLPGAAAALGNFCRMVPHPVTHGAGRDKEFFCRQGDRAQARQGFKGQQALNRGDARGTHGGDDATEPLRLSTPSKSRITAQPACGKVHPLGFSIFRNTSDVARYSKCSLFD